MLLKMNSFLCAVGLSTSLYATSQTPPLKIDPYHLEQTQIIPHFQSQAYKYTLKNGLQLIVVPDMRNPIATLHFILDAGSNREKKGTTGLAHFFEHMMFRKTKGAPEGNYDRVINSVGGSGNAGTSDSFVTFYANFPAPALETMLKLESDRFINLDISEPNFSIEKGAVISERKLRVENDPMERSQEALRARTERDTPLEWMTIGSKADVENMSLQSAQEFYENFYTPDNTILVVGGPFKPAEALHLVESYFGSWQGKLTTLHAPYPQNYFSRDLEKSFICSAPIQTKKYTIKYPAAQANLEDYMYSLLFQTMLDDSPEGTFSRRLVKQELGTEFNFYQVYWQNQTSPFLANFSLTKEQDFEKARAFWHENVKRVLSTSLSDKIKRQVIKQLAVSNAEVSEKVTSLVSAVLDNTYFFHDFYAAQKTEKIIHDVTDSQFKAWVESNLNPHHNYTVGVVPVTEGVAPCIPHS